MSQHPIKDIGFSCNWWKDVAQSHNNVIYYRRKHYKLCSRGKSYRCSKSSVNEFQQRCVNGSRNYKETIMNFGLLDGPIGKIRTKEKRKKKEKKREWG
jgi:hypothetical protein